MGCLQPADILLPVQGTDLNKWAVIACDQFTGQPEYWKQVEDYVGDSPSVLQMIYPEVYLGSDNESVYREKIAGIQRNMKSYLSDGVLSESVHQGYVLVVRETESGIRIGLVAALDLEAYEYVKDTKARVRATEETVQSRIPVRVGIRKEAILESPHVMLLLDDEPCTLLEPLYKKKDNYRRLYDLELMLEGGRLQGYAIEGEDAKELTEQIAEMERKTPDFFLAVGDGNHSLAAAKACWEHIKMGLSKDECENHPARYALAEIVNLHSPALKFQAIHRVLYGGQMNALMDGFREYLKEQEISWTECAEKDHAADIIFIQDSQRSAWRIKDMNGHLAVEVIQHFLDIYLDGHPEMELDYIHSEAAVLEMTKKKEACGILLSVSGKGSLFPAIQAGGVLPRKTFSVGRDSEKRYYMECRRIMQ